VSRDSSFAGTVLILGGGGMVGLQVAREAARELKPQRIVISALFRAEVDSAIELLNSEAAIEGWSTSFAGAPADIFLPQALQGKDRAGLVDDRVLFDQLFDEIFSPDPESYKQSALYQLIDEHKPDVVVDCINTATAISYQDVYTVSRRLKLIVDQLDDRGEGASDAELKPLIRNVRELLIAQEVPQITRHILLLHRALEQSGVYAYVKVGTTGTGGMGINIPYTHSEEKPSAKLLSKSAVGFAHTGLLFLLARTPGNVRHGDGTIVKEVKPAAMIGFKRLGMNHVKLTGESGRREPGYLLEPKQELLDGPLATREPFAAYGRFENRDVPLKMIGADTGENGFFSIGEFRAITYPRQMEYVTPEEVARTVVLEILGASTGRDVLSAIDGALTEPSYRAGVLREQACREMEHLEELFAHDADSEALPSIALGHLGPPRLSKLLIEAYLLRAAGGSSGLDALIAIAPAEMQAKVESYLAANPRIVSLVVTIGIPLLRDAGGKPALTRGPRLNIPPEPPGGGRVPADPASIETFAVKGWVDLRLANFEAWHERLRKIASSRPDIVRYGSAAFDLTKYMPREFIPGDVVGWLLTNETDEQGMVGRRLF
jgi:hypothetical protein